MDSSIDKKLFPDFNDIKDLDEELLWTRKPLFIPYILSGYGGSSFILIFGLIWLGLSSMVSTNVFLRFVGLIPSLQIPYIFLTRLLSYPNTAYGYSNKRILIKTGILKEQVKMLYHDKYSNVELLPNTIEDLFYCGTVKFYIGDKDEQVIYGYWASIPDSYPSWQQVKRMSDEIKGSFFYPRMSYIHSDEMTDILIDTIKDRLSDSLNGENAFRIMLSNFIELEMTTLYSRYFKEEIFELHFDDLFVSIGATEKKGSIYMSRDFKFFDASDETIELHFELFFENFAIKSGINPNSGVSVEYSRKTMEDFGSVGNEEDYDSLTKSIENNSIYLLIKDQVPTSYKLFVNYNV